MRVVIRELLNTDWHLRQVIRRPVAPYDPDAGPAIYRDGGWARPIEPVTRMTEAEADSLPMLHPVIRPLRFRTAGLEAVIDPDRLPQDGAGVGYLERADIAILRIIADSWPGRPIYFARSAETEAHKLGLGPWLVTHGLARKLSAQPAAESASVLPSEPGWFDVARTRILWQDVYRGPRALANRDGWVDRPSVSIPYLYAITGAELAEAERVAGRERDGARVQALAERIAERVRLRSAR